MPLSLGTELWGISSGLSLNPSGVYPIWGRGIGKKGTPLWAIRDEAGTELASYSEWFSRYTCD